MVAIADDRLVAHPGDPFSTAGVVMAIAGPAVYLLGGVSYPLLAGITNTAGGSGPDRVKNRRPDRRISHRCHHWAKANRGRATSPF
jgi:hypothetical protein